MRGVAEISVPNKQEYCDRHGYTLVTRDYWKHHRHPLWAKWDLGMESLASFDWVCIADVDLLIMNMNKPLEPFIENTTADLIATLDQYGLNTAFTFCRNTPWSAGILKLLWDTGHDCPHPCPDQTRLAYMLYREPKSSWDVIPQKQINCYLYQKYPHEYGEQSGQFQPGDFVLHLPGMAQQARVDTMKEYLPLVIH